MGLHTKLLAEDGDYFPTQQDMQQLTYSIALTSQHGDIDLDAATGDVSGSVANVSRFFLMFLHSLTEILPNVRTFAFSNKAGEVTDLFENKDIEVAAAETLLLNGGGSTDYGQAFVDLEGLLENNIDRKTTVIILGDARSNYGDPRCDVLKTIQEKSKRILFLNPEPKSVWGTGDSEMLRFVPYCSKSKVCSSLFDLERVVDDMLRSSI